MVSRLALKQRGHTALLVGVDGAIQLVRRHSIEPDRPLTRSILLQPDVRGVVLFSRFFSHISAIVYPGSEDHGAPAA